MSINSAIIYFSINNNERKRANTLESSWKLILTLVIYMSAHTKAWENDKNQQPDEEK